MKIGMITQWYDPETGPASIPAIFARGFVAAGHEVQVLTGFPNYPHGRIYPGYRQRWRMKEVIDGVEVCRVPLVPNHGSSAIGRIMNYASFALSAAFLAGRPLRDVDVIWVYNSPPTLVLPVAVHSRRGRIPVFLHVQDLWPESMTASGMLPTGWISASAARLGGYFELVLERLATRIGVISSGMKARIIRENPALRPESIVLAPNPAGERDVERWVEPDCETTRARVVYAGAIGQAQGLETLIGAAELLRSREVAVDIVIAGDGPSRTRLESLARARGLDNVKFLGRLSRSDVDHLTREAIAHLVVLADTPHLRITMPSKIADLLHRGTPVVASVSGDPARLLEESGGAIVSAASDEVQLAAAIETVVRMDPAERLQLSKNARDYYAARLSQVVTVTGLVDELRKTAANA